jgi:hypothetical protein
MLCDAANIIIAFTVEKENLWPRKYTMNTSQHLSQSSMFRRRKRCTQRDWRLLQSAAPLRLNITEAGMHEMTLADCDAVTSPIEGLDHP